MKFTIEQHMDYILEMLRLGANIRLIWHQGRKKDRGLVSITEGASE